MTDPTIAPVNLSSSYQDQTLGVSGTSDLNNDLTSLQTEIAALQTPTTTSTGTQPNTNATSTPAPTTPGVSGQPTAAAPGTLSTTPGSLVGTGLTSAQDQTIQNQNLQNATNPALPAGATATPVNQQVQSGEMLSDQTIDPNADQVNTSDANINASTVGQTATAAQPNQVTAATYQATQIDPATLANTTQAVTAAMPADALVSQQLQELLTPDANGNLPAWVQPAVTAANQFLAGRGISNSSMAGQAITSAILTAAIPVATSNASAVLTAWQQNLTDEQQAALQNGQAVVQGMFNNQSAANAAANFNATSTDQTNQFMASLATQVNQFNATQTNSIAQFNASQTQSAATSSAQLLSQLDQFNANMANQREQFNTQNAIIIQQSNAEYLRAVNTANTAVANQDNQLNAQNTMNLSDQAMANLQQQFNDEATMLYNSNMTAEEQNYSIAYLSQQYGLQDTLDQNITDMQENVALQNQIGTLVGQLFTPIGAAAGSAVSNLFSSSNSSGGTGTSSTDTNSGTSALDPNNSNATDVGGETNPADTNTDSSEDDGGGDDGGDE